MIKEFNWGHGITIFYLCFVGIVVTALIASFGVDRSLVVDDYYAKDLGYQEQYDKQFNSMTSNSLDVKVVENQVVLHFLDGKKIEGSVQFYRASDKNQDFTELIHSNLMIIPTSELTKGKWSLKIIWTEDGKSFYKEKMIVL